MLADQKNLPSLNLKAATTTFSTLNEILQNEKGILSLGYSSKLIGDIAQSLQLCHDLNLLDDAMLTVLKVNKAGSVLHKAVINGKYDAYLKPIFIKDKSINNSIKSPFIEALTEEELNKRNQDLKEYDIRLANIDLSYPFEHLEKLAKLALNPDEPSGDKYISLEKIDQQNNSLQIKETQTGDIYYVELPFDISQEKELTKDTFFAFVNESKLSGLVNILNHQKQSVEVLAASDKQGEFLPIICDIDAHNLGIRKGNLSKTYDTSILDEQEQLKKAITTIFEQAKQQNNLQEYIAAINPLMGHIGAEEFIVFYTINKTCNRFIGLNAVFQHGATASMSDEDIKKVYAPRSNKFFPAITNDTAIVSVSRTEKNTVITLEGASILFFYSILNQQEYGYSFNLLELWKEQLNMLEKAGEHDAQRIESIVNIIKDGLEEYKVIAHQQSDIAATSSSDNLSIQSLVHNRYATFQARISNMDLLARVQAIRTFIRNEVIIPLTDQEIQNDLQELRNKTHGI